LDEKQIRFGSTIEDNTDIIERGLKMKKQLASWAMVIVLVLSVVTACAKAAPPLSAAELLDLGEKYLLELNYEQALVQFLKVIEVEPMNPRGYTGAAEAYIGLGQPDKAEEILRQGLMSLPDNTQILAMLNDLPSQESPSEFADFAPNPDFEHTETYLLSLTPDEIISNVQNRWNLAYTWNNTGEPQQGVIPYYVLQNLIGIEIFLPQTDTGLVAVLGGFGNWWAQTDAIPWSNGRVTIRADDFLENPADIIKMDLTKWQHGGYLYLIDGGWATTWAEFGVTQILIHYIEPEQSVSLDTHTVVGTVLNVMDFDNYLDTYLSYIAQRSDPVAVATGVRFAEPIVLPSGETVSIARYWGSPVRITDQEIYEHGGTFTMTGWLFHHDLGEFGPAPWIDYEGDMYNPWGGYNFYVHSISR
jgi:hypothetical protein